VLVYVQVAKSPSFRLIVETPVARTVLVVPALDGLAACRLQTRLVSAQCAAGGWVSVTVLVEPAPKVRRFEKTFWFCVPVPSSTRLNDDGVISGPLSVNGNEVLEFGTASLMTVICPGKMTAAADSERSWLPPTPSRSISRVW
jgi:hypothetical protein